MRDYFRSRSTIQLPSTEYNFRQHLLYHDASFIAFSMNELKKANCTKPWCYRIKTVIISLNRYYLQIHLQIDIFFFCKLLKGCQKFGKVRVFLFESAASEFMSHAVLVL